MQRRQADVEGSAIKIRAILKGWRGAESSVSDCAEQMQRLLRSALESLGWDLNTGNMLHLTDEIVLALYPDSEAAEAIMRLRPEFDLASGVDGRPDNVANRAMGNLMKKIAWADGDASVAQAATAVEAHLLARGEYEEFPEWRPLSS